MYKIQQCPTLSVVLPLATGFLTLVVLLNLSLTVPISCWSVTVLLAIHSGTFLATAYCTQYWCCVTVSELYLLLLIWSNVNTNGLTIIHIITNRIHYTSDTLHTPTTITTVLHTLLRQRATITTVLHTFQWQHMYTLRQHMYTLLRDMLYNNNYPYTLLLVHCSLLLDLATPDLSLISDIRSLMLCGSGSRISGAKLIFSVTLTKACIGWSCSFILRQYYTESHVCTCTNLDNADLAFSTSASGTSSSSTVEHILHLYT